MSYYDILLAKQLSGGGGDITVESLSVTANGTYSAPSGKAYSPVVANVPNSYTASDEGKVVSSGALVAQTSQTIDTNGTYDTTLKNSVTVNVSGGGGGGLSTVISGSFTGTTTGLTQIELPYEGTGYPIALAIMPVGGAKANIGSLSTNYQAVVAFKINVGAPSSAATSKYWTGLTVYNNYGDLTINSFNNTALSYINGATYSVGFKDAKTLTIRFADSATDGYIIGKEFRYMIMYCEV